MKAVNTVNVTHIGIIATYNLQALSRLREESSQTNVILQHKLLASILSAVCCVIQQS